MSVIYNRFCHASNSKQQMRCAECEIYPPVDERDIRHTIISIRRALYKMKTRLMNDDRYRCAIGASCYHF